MMRLRRAHVGAMLLCLALAAALVLLCSQSAPIYPINTWDDANCLLTVGRVMREGGVLYRDIYEQKGPTLYLIHAAAAAISSASFFGVYVMEVLSLAAALYLAQRIMRRRMPFAAALSLTALFGACVLVSTSFSRGDSAEEFCLPLLMGALHIALGEYEDRKGPMRPKMLFCCGLLAGGVATIKYTVLGLFIGLCLCEGILALREGGLARAFKSAGAFLAGMLLPVAAWGIYFAANGALGDAVQAYLYNNIFLYQGERTLLNALWEMAAAARDNLIWVLPAALSMIAYCADGEIGAQARLCAGLMAACALVAVFFLGRVWPYCPLVLCVFAVPGAYRGVRLAQSRLAGLSLPRMLGRGGHIAVGACVLAALCMGLWLSPNAYLRGVKRSDTAQGRLAAVMEPGATLLQYNHLDDGLYLFSGTLPQEKYFVRLNVALQEMEDALEEAVREGRPDYVLVSWRELPDTYGNYALIATEVGYDERGRLGKPLYLYGRARP